MKFELLLLPLLATAPFAASAAPRVASVQPAAQVKTSLAAPLEVDPAAKGLLDQAQAMYRSPRSLSFEVASSGSKATVAQSSVLFRAPNAAVLTQKTDPDIKAIYCADNHLFVDRGVTYSDLSLPSGQFPPVTAMGIVSRAGNAGAGDLIAGWLQGRSPLEDLEEEASDPKFASLYRVRVTRIAPAVFNSEVLRGVQIAYSPVPASDAPQPEEQVLWFDAAAPLLRRVEVFHHSKAGQTKIESDIVSNLRFNPAIAPSSFAFDAGARTSTNDTSPFQYDPRLVPGTFPVAFNALSLDGQPISPKPGQGKVLLMDFWATWCGPCVASLPELQGIYNKYHGQGLDVVGISLDEDKDALTSFVKAKNMVWPQVFDGKGWGAEVPGLYGVHAIPFMLIIGKDGKIAAVNSRDDLEGAVKSALAVS